MDNPMVHSSSGILIRSNSQSETFDLNLSEVNIQKMNKAAKIVPNLKKKDLANMKPDERDEIVDLSIDMTVQWVHAFLDEVYRIDDFFKAKQMELINNFIGLQDKFRIRTEKYELGSTRTAKTARSKKSDAEVKQDASDLLQSPKASMNGTRYSQISDRPNMMKD